MADETRVCPKCGGVAFKLPDINAAEVANDPTVEFKVVGHTLWCTKCGHEEKVR